MSRGAVDETPPPEWALAMFTRKPRAKKTPPAPAPYPEMGLDLGRALNRVAELERLMLARQQRARGLTQPHRLGLVGGREQLQERLAELPGIGNPYTSMGSRS